MTDVAVQGSVAAPRLQSHAAGGEPDGRRLGAHGREPWTSGGFSTNTSRAADINPGRASSDPRDITVIGQKAFFSANDGTHGRELWKVTVPPTPSIYLSGPSTAVAAGSPATVTVVLNGPDATSLPQPAGTVAFYSGGTRFATVPVTAGPAPGQATASATVTARTGTQQIVAVYRGDVTYLSTASNTYLLTAQ